MAEQPEHDLEPDVMNLMIPTPADVPGRRARATDDAWEAVVREELLQLHRRHARDRRAARRLPQETPWATTGSRPRSSSATPPRRAR